MLRRVKPDPWIGRVFEALCESCRAVRRVPVQFVDVEAGYRVLKAVCPVCGSIMLLATTRQDKP